MTQRLNDLLWLVQSTEAWSCLALTEDLDWPYTPLLGVDDNGHPPPAVVSVYFPRLIVSRCRYLHVSYGWNAKDTLLQEKKISSPNQVTQPEKALDRG